LLSFNSFSVFLINQQGNLCFYTIFFYLLPVRIRVMQWRDGGNPALRLVVVLRNRGL
jgi:hypothetical protein